jgi:hypothetical protein
MRRRAQRWSHLPSVPPMPLPPLRHPPRHRPPALERNHRSEIGRLGPWKNQNHIHTHSRHNTQISTTLVFEIKCYCVSPAKSPPRARARAFKTARKHRSESYIEELVGNIVGAECQAQARAERLLLVSQPARRTHARYGDNPYTHRQHRP